MMRHARTRALLALVGAMLLQSACASSRPAAMRHLAGRVMAPSGPPITRLPEAVTYAWVDPTTMLRHMTPLQAARSAERDVVSLRGDVNVVLLSHGWREVPAAPEYELTFAVIDQPPPAHSSVRGSNTAVRRAELPVCTGGEREIIGSNCQAVMTEPDVLNADQRRGPGAWLAYVIRRVDDGATYQWVAWVNHYTTPRDLSLARPTLELFLGAPSQD
jgi:hypothetical protein